MSRTPRSCRQKSTLSLRVSRVCLSTLPALLLLLFCCCCQFVWINQFARSQQKTQATNLIVSQQIYLDSANPASATHLPMSSMNSLYFNFLVSHARRLSSIRNESKSSIVDCRRRSRCGRSILAEGQRRIKMYPTNQRGHSSAAAAS